MKAVLVGQVLADLALQLETIEIIAGGFVKQLKQWVKTIQVPAQLGLVGQL